MCETSELVIARRSAVAARQRWSTVTVLVNETGETLVGCHRVIEFWHWSSFCSCCFVLSLSLLLVLSLCVFHPFSRQSDRVCPTGQPFSTHHAHHFLSSFPPVCFFHLFWPVHSPSTTPRKPFYLFVCVCVFVPQCAAHKITLNNI